MAHEEQPRRAAEIPEWELEEMIRDVIEQRCGVTSPTERWHGSTSA
jgi:hypothetical protein